MGRQYFGRTTVEAYLLINTDINLREIVAVEIGTEHLTILDDMLGLQLRLGAIDEPCRIELDRKSVV